MRRRTLDFVIVVIRRGGDGDAQRLERGELQIVPTGQKAHTGGGDVTGAETAVGGAPLGALEGGAGRRSPYPAIGVVLAGTQEAGGVTAAPRGGVVDVE